MGKPDVVLKQWLKNKVRFADLFNAVIFDGEQVIKPEELEELNSEAGIVIASAIDEVGTSEFFSRFRKQDRLCPVITIVFYYGEEPWDGATELYELFGVKDKELIHILQKYVSNYRMNLIEVNGEEDVTKFKSDLQIMFSVLKYRKDKRRLFEYTKEQKDGLDKLDYESLQAMAVLLKTPQLLAKMNEKKGAERNMCQALEEYYQDGVQEGIEKGILQGIEQGIERGIEQGKKSVVVNMLKKGFDVELIAELAGLSVVDIRMICNEI